MLTKERIVLIAKMRRHFAIASRYTTSSVMTKVDLAKKNEKILPP